MNGINNPYIALYQQMAALELAQQAQQGPQDGFVTPPNQAVQANPNALNAPGRVQRQPRFLANAVNNQAVVQAHLRAQAAAALLQNNVVDQE